MEEKDKREFDALHAFVSMFYERFNARRTYEWKFALSVWTAFAAYAGSSVFREPSRQDLVSITAQAQPAAVPPSLIGVIIIGGFIFYLHRRWLNHLTLRNHSDMETARIFEGKMIAKLNFSDEIKSEMERIQNKFPVPPRWSSWIQIWITALLYLGAVLASFFYS